MPLLSDIRFQEVLDKLDRLSKADLARREIKEFRELVKKQYRNCWDHKKCREFDKLAYKVSQLENWKEDPTRRDVAGDLRRRITGKRKRKKIK